MIGKPDMLDRNIGSPDPSAPRSLSDSQRSHDSSSNGTAAADDSANIRATVDLVAAAHRHLSFLRFLAGSPLLHHPTVILRSIRRYEEIWMPMMAGLTIESSSAPMLLPPPDVDWVWLCHCLDPEGYGDYCASRFRVLVDRPVILDQENEDYAACRCREIWDLRHPSEPFDLDIDADVSSDAAASDAGEIFAAVAKQRELCSFFTEPFVTETVYLVSARRRYLNFLHLLKNSSGESFRMVPASDILLMWHTHKSFPGRYVMDLEGIGDLRKRVVGFSELAATEEAAERTRTTWEKVFDEPYERAGTAMDPLASPARVFFNWEASNGDVNRAYKGLQPRFLMELIVFLKGNWDENEPRNVQRTFLRIRTIRCHKELKLDKSASESSSDQWQKSWHLFCEFGTRGIVIEVRQHVGGCLRNSKLLNKVYFYWNDLLRSTTLTLAKKLEFKVRSLSSLTPPVQASYLLKSVPDCVTDDSGAMISDVILRMRRYRPQEGRWLCRTILDHAGRGCFVIRTRVGRGFWRRGAEAPTPVKWEERIIEVREGQWSYVASSVGYAPEKVVGTATPTREDSKERKVVWSLSTGDVLVIHWENGLIFQLQNESLDSSANLMVLQGRKLQYQVKEANPEEEQHYVTIVRSNSESPDGKATALLNWKLQAVEFLPEEDAVLVLLLNMSILRTMSQIRREDIGGLLVRRRVREVSPGLRDWGSVLLPSSSYDLFPHFKPWYWNNASEVLASAEANDWRGIHYKYSPADGKDELYRSNILS